MRSSQSFQASTDTFSKMRWPSSPGQGGASRPGSSFWNFDAEHLSPGFVRGGFRRLTARPHASAMPKLYVFQSAPRRELGLDREREPRVRRSQRIDDGAWIAARAKMKPR